MGKLFTSESVTEGHPDKLCDYISDSILDAYLAKDEMSRVACETAAGKDTIFVTGEITSNAEVDIESVVRQAIKEIGYDDEACGMDYKTCKVIITISKQSQDIALGVDSSLETKNNEENIISEGAGDQGMMFGYATKETDNYMPMPIYLSHKLAKRLSEVRKNHLVDYLRPDAKAQVTVEYVADIPVRVDTVVLSTQHNEKVDLETLRKDMMELVIKEVIPERMLDKNTKYYINPTGRFVIGGPKGDSGLTGRKIIVDTYGGFARHGGGAFSGKDPTKVDRSASYMARFIAKNIVANGIADRCEVQLSYAIGVAKPVAVYVNTFGTNKISEDEITKFIWETFNMTPSGIIRILDLRKPIYRKTTNYGHFGKDDLPWEKVHNIWETVEVEVM